MDFYKLFYFFAMADKLSSLFLTLAILSTFSLLLFNGISLFADTEDYQSEKSILPPWFVNARFIARATLFVAPISWILYIATPTKKEAVIIVAGGYVGNFVQSDTNAKQLPADITRFLRTQINQASFEAGLKEVIGEPSKEEKLKDMSREELLQEALKDK